MAFTKSNRCDLKHLKRAQVTLDLLFKGYVSKPAIHPNKQPRLSDFTGLFACQECRFR